jgi:hypothetical protein
VCCRNERVLQILSVEPWKKNVAVERNERWRNEEKVGKEEVRDVDEKSG